MAGEVPITIVGNIAGEPVLKFSPNGVAVLNFTVAQTPRNKDRQSDQWVDGEPMWFRVTVFKSDAEVASESLVKGSRVIVVGRMSVQSWETKEGEKRTDMKVIAEEVGLSAKWHTLKATKFERGGSSGGARKPAEDPWSGSPPQDDEPPF